MQTAGSLQIWGRYFPNASMLVGCDPDPQSASPTCDDPRIRLVVGDARSDDAEGRVNAHSSAWDIVIEHGAQASCHKVDVFARFFPKVSEGGIFIAEDLRGSYWREFEGGLADPFSSVAFYKRLADLVNFEHWGMQISRAEYLAGFARHCGCHFVEAELAQVHSVEFVNAQCAIRKRSAADNLLGPRLIAGAGAKPSTQVGEEGGTVGRALDQTSNPWSDTRLIDLADGARFAARYAIMEALALKAIAQASRQIEQIRDLEAQLAHGAKALAERESAMQRLAEHEVAEEVRQIDEYRAREQDLMATVQARDEQIAALLAALSKPSARLGRLIERVARKLFPMGSLRRKALVRVWKLAERFYDRRLVLWLRSRRAVGATASPVQDLVTDDASAQPPEFAAWIRIHEPDDAERARQRLASAPYNPAAPLFSVLVPVYKVPSAVLEATIASVRNQSWQDWELCIAYADLDNHHNWALLERIAMEDLRLKVHRLGENGGISRNSNAALRFACGRFIALLDHDDELTPWALHDMATRIAAVPDADFLYSDTDSINASGTLRLNPLFKPAWSPEMMLSVNYLTHLNVMRRSIVQAVGGWNPDTDGAQDWDIFFRVAEKSRRIERVPGIHYHWRMMPGSTAGGIVAKPYALLGQLQTLKMRVQRLGLAAGVQRDRESGYRLVWHLDGRPEVDLILHGDCGDVFSVLGMLVEQCAGMLASITLCWTEPGAPPALPKGLTGGVPFAVVRSPEGDKTVAIAEAVESGRAPAVLLLDRAVKRLAPHSLRDLAAWVLKHPEIGFSSALVLLDDDTVVEAGRVVGRGGVTQPMFRGSPLRQGGLMGEPLWYRNITAAADTAMAFKRDRLQLSEYRGMPWAQALVAICATARGSDRRGVVVPQARAFVERMPALSDGWHDSMRDDPYFHPAFTSVVPLALDLDEPSGA